MGNGTERQCWHPFVVNGVCQYCQKHDVLSPDPVTLESLDAKMDFIKALVDDLQQQVTRQHRHQPHTMRRQDCPDCDRRGT